MITYNLVGSAIQLCMAVTGAVKVNTESHTGGAVDKFVVRYKLLFVNHIKPKLVLDLLNARYSQKLPLVLNPAEAVFPVLTALRLSCVFS